MLEVVKISGEREPFNRNKLCSSLKKAGASHAFANTICTQVEKRIVPGASTTRVYREALRSLVKNNIEIAARYSLFRGIAALGPAGFLFEQYVETILQSHGFTTKRDVYVQGMCIKHEVDIVAIKDNEHYILELKYHNQQGIKTHVPTVMYAYARLDDITRGENKRERNKHHHAMWLITNTKFTDTAITYAKCKQIRLTGWTYPKGNSLEEMIISKKMYPVTVLPSINSNLLTVLAQKGIILAQDLATYSVNDLKRFGVDEKQALKIINEVAGLFNT